MEDVEKGKILKESLMIVNELAKSELGDIDGDITNNDFDVEQLQKLVLRARKLKRNKYFKF